MSEFFNEHNFDIYEPEQGHEIRFIEKLHAQKQQKKYPLRWMAIAASIILFVGFTLGSYYQTNDYDLKDVSGEMAEAQDFFKSAIQADIKKIEGFRSSETNKIIDDAFFKLEDLEIQYQELKDNLKTSDNTKLIIMEMIENYQLRLEILHHVLQVLEKHKITQLNKNNDEIS